MGTWGHAYDANDEGSEFIDIVMADGEWDAVSRCISTYVDQGGYADAQEAVAALELTAAALDRPHADMEEEHRAWAARHRDEAASLRDLALRAVDLVRDRSELAELWSEGGVDPEHRDGWRREIDDLRMRLAT